MLGDTPDADAEHSLAGAENARTDLAYRPQIRRSERSLRLSESRNEPGGGRQVELDRTVR